MIRREDSIRPGHAVHSLLGQGFTAATVSGPMRWPQTRRHAAPASHLLHNLTHGAGESVLTNTTGHKLEESGC